MVELGRLVRGSLVAPERTDIGYRPGEEVSNIVELCGFAVVEEVCLQVEDAVRIDRPANFRREEVLDVGPRSGRLEEGAT